MKKASGKVPMIFPFIKQGDNMCVRIPYLINEQEMSNDTYAP